ncbi:hypothetical protein DFH06DRAFT_1001814 [Mycena polygramma]|nr:hypothetical protein DFH06DRAFT_1001814 [Mycena polygramma]
MYQPVDQLWFSPNVVILRAQTRTFRVFVDILKEKSTVFADMFTFPQPPSSGMETVDGVPVVIVHDDPAEMEVFLKAIFDSNFFMPPPAESQIMDTLGILRLAHKYDVPYLRRRALEHLGTIHPTQLSQWNNIEKVHPSDSTAFGHRIATIRTATEVEALWLLPTAYYDICRRQLSSIIEDSRWLALGDTERNACCRGHQAQIQQTLQVMSFLSITKDESGDCEDPARCNKKRLGMTKLYLTLRGHMSRPLDILGESHWKTIGERLCENCTEEAFSLHNAAKQNCWDGIPEMFGLPGWDILEGMRTAALAT